jgi:molybdopterin synthase sulfur carrier subunit
LTNGQARVDVPPGSVDTMISVLDAKFPGLRAQLCDDSGDVKAFINLFVNGNEIRTLQGRETPVGESDEVSIIPAMAGGR